MKKKQVSALAALAAVSLGVSSAHAVQKHDPIFQRTYAPLSQASDADVVHQVRNQAGSPKAKADLYVAQPASPGVNARDLAREVRFMSGSPKAKADQRFELAPLK